MARLILCLMFLMPAAAAAGPYYFITVRAGAEDLEQSHKVLREMVKLADAQHVKLTLLVSAQYALFTATDTTLSIEMENWKAAGHEVGAYHQGPDTKEWDGYSDLPEEGLARLRKGESSPGAVLGHGDFLAALDRLAAGIRTGCMAGKADKKFLAAAPVYETCLPPGNSVKNLTKRVDAGADGVNDFAAPVPLRGEGRFRLSCFSPSDRESAEAAKKAFDAAGAGVYGASFNSASTGFGAFFAWLKFLKSRDPEGLRSRTVSDVFKFKLIPDKRPQVNAVRGPEPQKVPAVQKTEIPKLQHISSPYSQVERMMHGSGRNLRQMQAPFCGDGVCSPSEKSGPGRCPRDCGI